MKILRTPEQHAEALKRIAQLASRVESLKEHEKDELDVLILLAQTYEKEYQPVAPPSPVEAIRFRMEQMGYKQKDLAKLVGGASRASEIMTGKRGLTTEMMRKLRDEWGIPADSLLGGPEAPDPTAPDSGTVGARDPKNYPMKQMYDRDYFPGRSREWKKHGRDLAGLLHAFYAKACGRDRVLAHCRQGGGPQAKLNPHALEAWQLRVLMRMVEEKNDLPAYDRTELNPTFLRWLAGLSCLPEGPRLACEALEQKGVAVILEAHLDQTRLDGAALLGVDGRPVIGLTLRHNRLDNFWFTLFHEIGHVLLHLSPEHPALLDVDIDQKKTERIEAEADRFALDTLIAPEIWQAQARYLQYAAEIRGMAKLLCVSPAVLAGRLRREANDYRLHRTLIGNGETRAALGIDETKWTK
jgi:HTH-type transcriptional regulator/antitoxin HigA